MKYREEFAKLLVLDSDAERGDLLQELTPKLEEDELELITQKDLLATAVSDLEEQKEKYEALKRSYYNYMNTNGKSTAATAEEEKEEEELLTFTAEDGKDFFSNIKF